MVKVSCVYSLVDGSIFGTRKVTDIQGPEYHLNEFRKEPWDSSSNKSLTVEITVNEFWVLTRVPSFHAG